MHPTTQETQEPHYQTAWQCFIRSATGPWPEVLPLFLLPGIQCLLDLLGEFQVSRVDPLPNAPIGERTFYILKYAENLAFRKDESYSGLGSVAFYGPGSMGDTLDQLFVRAINEIQYFHGCILVNPPEPIFGPVVSPGRIDIYGKSREPIEEREKLKLAMEHSLGRVPIDWPIHSKLEAL